MLTELVRALFVVAGGACAMAGYAIGAWHERRSTECDIAAELMSDLNFEAPVPPRDRRLN